ncbi:MAG: tRNA (N(6)-L-threonylcarbamoyladenosine(37)-C(2))-methylthiotransferase MtaB [Coprobacillus sp.]|nr:tRNA (N(6)-L-threonylcarbamoyladenosine(37)-C(2))-methylthiotransferase MtaB [Coprobacillus sp.]
MERTINYYYLGCKVNHYECSAVLSDFTRHGFTLSKKDPEVVLVNTCSVTATSDQKSRQLIRRVRKNNPHSILVVMGCFIQGHQAIVSDFDADIIIGTSHRNELYDLVNKFKETHERIVLIDSNPSTFQYEELGTTSLAENVRAYLKIQDGCNNFCSYCLIPYIRGRSRSRKEEDIIKEAEYLVDEGYKEIVITGIDMGSYGEDNGQNSFSDLMEKLLNIKGLERLRIGSLEASQIDDHLISLFSKYDNLARHLHIPLQSGSPKVLKDMHRKYDIDEFYNKVKKIREAVPGIALTTDVIVGFPSETEADFNQTYEFIKKCDFMMVHTFPFSLRKGTLAEKIPNIVSDKEKNERTHKLLDLSKELLDKYESSYIGKEVDVLIEYYDEKENSYFGHSSNYLPIHIGNKDVKVGQMIKTTYKKV